MSQKATKTRSLEIYTTEHKCKTSNTIKLSRSILNIKTIYSVLAFDVLWAAPILIEDINRYKFGCWFLGIGHALMNLH